MGKKFDDSSANSTNSFHELCCGTHVDNTKYLNNFVITGIDSFGDFSFEIEACVGREAVEVKRNEKILNDIYEEITKIEMNSHEGINEVSRKCAEIELLQQYWKLSYSFRAKLYKNLELCRPSRHQVKKHLGKHFESVILDSEKIDASDSNLKFFSYNSILPIVEVLSIFSKVSRIPNSLLAFNKLRNELIVYSYENGNNTHEKFFELIEKVLRDNSIAFVKLDLQTKENLKVLKIHKNTNKSKIIELCKNIEKI
jgi:hypothetical protein